MGVDIDSQMIKAAIGNLHKLVNREEVKKEMLENNSEHTGEREDMQMLNAVE